MDGDDFLALSRDLDHKLRWRRRVCRVLTFGRHSFGEPWRVDAGPIGFEESDETLLGWSKQCRACYHCEDA